MTPRPATPGLHALITTRTGEIHHYVLPVRLDRGDGLATNGEPVVLIVTATADEGSLALRGVEPRRSVVEP